MLITCRVCKRNDLDEVEDFPTYRYKGTLKRRKICKSCYYVQSKAVPSGSKERRARYHRKFTDGKPGSCMIGSRYKMSQKEYSDKLEEQANSCPQRAK